MSLNSNVLYTSSEGIQCELGTESYRNCISSMRSEHSDSSEYGVSSEYQGIDLSMKQEKFFNRTDIQTKNKQYEPCKSDAEDRSNIVVEVDPSIYSPDSEVEFCEFVCGDCGLQYPDGTAYEAHCKAHNSKEPFKCIECSLRFQDHCSFELHREIHFVKRYNCTDCKKRFSFKWSLMVHSQVHRSRPQSNCEICGLQFLNSEFLSSHRSIHHVEEYSSGEHQSSNCSKGINCKSENNEEYESVSKAGNIFDCEHCDLKFESESDISDHQKIHNGLLMFRCELCKIICVSYSELRDHVNFNHNDFDVHFCEDCGGTGFVSLSDDEPVASSVQNLEAHCATNNMEGCVKKKPMSKMCGTVSKKTVKIKRPERHVVRTLRSVKHKTKSILEKVSFEVAIDETCSRKFCDLKLKKEPFTNRKRKGQIVYVDTA